MRSREPGRPRTNAILQLTAFVSTFDRFAMPPMLVAISIDLGVPLPKIVQAASVYFIVYGLGQPIWGMVSDSLGLVRTMRLSLALAAVCTAASALAWTPALFIAMRAAAGGFFGAAIPSTLIYVGDTVPSRYRQRDVTRLMTGVAVGTASALVVAGVVADFLSWRVMFLVTGAMAATLAVAARRLPDPATKRAGNRPLSSIRPVIRSRSALLVLGLAFAEGAVLLGGLTLLPASVEAAGASATVAGGVTGGFGLAVLVAAPLVGRLSLRLHPSRLIAIGAAAGGIGYVILALSQHPGAAAVVAVLLGVAWAGMHSSLQTWATEVLPSARAVVVSLFAASLFAGSAAATAAASGLAGAGNYGMIYAVAAVAIVPLGSIAAWSRARWS